MLGEIRVSNFALIEDLTLRLGPGLNILSGETGAGKSVVIGAINLLLGERADIDQIRQGEENAFVEGIFESAHRFFPEIGEMLAGAGIEGGETLIVARELSRRGRSVGRVNGRAVPIAFLKELGEMLVDLHGQHQHQSLLRPDYQLALLDAYGGEKITAASKEVAELYRELGKLKNNLAALGRDSAERERRMDILSFQIKEIKEARLERDEEEELLKKEKILAHAEKITALVEDSYNELYRGDERRAAPAVIDALAACRDRLKEAAQIDPALASLVGLLESAAAQLEEISFTLRDYQASFEYNPAELEAIQKRLEQLLALKKKYGPTVAEVIAFGEAAAEKLDRLRNSESLARELEAKIAELSQRLTGACRKLTQLRVEAAASMEPLLESALQELALPRSRFRVSISELESYTARGGDRIEFLFSANPGEAVKPLSKIISGGEMSRVMLAIKAIFAGQERIPILIFDEVDAGIGGAPIQAVAEKLALLAKHHQVICVTHSPQIAAMADHHIRLYKELSGERTQTLAEMLESAERRMEIARMLDGASVDRAGLEHVDSLLERAERFKEESRRTTSKAKGTGR